MTFDDVRAWRTASAADPPEARLLESRAALDRRTACRTRRAVRRGDAVASVLEARYANLRVPESAGASFEGPPGLVQRPPLSAAFVLAAFLLPLYALPFGVLTAAWDDAPLTAVNVLPQGLLFGVLMVGFNLVSAARRFADPASAFSKAPARTLNAAPRGVARRR